jgi:hypothetical protein
MLVRRREHILAIAALLVLNALLGWYLERLRKDYRNRTQWIYAGPVASTTPTNSGRPTQPAGTQDWSEIVNRNLFTPERSTQAPEEKQAKAPELPLLFGTMNLGSGWFALMAPGDQASPASKKVLPGEAIGGYKLVSIATSQVVVEWEEKKFTIDVSESARRVPRIVDKTASARADRAAATPPPVTSVGTASARAASTAPTLTTTGGKKAAANYVPPGADPDAPAGTIVGGRRKVVVPTPFGPQVYWEEVEQPGASAPIQNPKKEQ